MARRTKKPPKKETKPDAIARVPVDDPEVLALFNETLGDDEAENADLQEDIGLPRLNLKTFPDGGGDYAILAQTKAHAYWMEKFSGGGGQPDCWSADGKLGQGKRRLPDGSVEEGQRGCKSCPNNQFGSDEGTRAKACRNNRVLIIQNVDAKLPSPELLVVSPTGLKAIASYLRELINDGVPRWTVATSITKVDSDRTPMGEFVYERGAMLTPGQAKLIVPLVRQFKEAKKTAAAFKAQDLSADAAGEAFDY